MCVCCTQIVIPFILYFAIEIELGSVILKTVNVSIEHVLNNHSIKAQNKIKNKSMVVELTKSWLLWIRDR